MKRKTKNRFLLENPFCCYCGGTIKSETVDHNPAKIFFVNRRPPEGFEFGSCNTCNQGTSKDENRLGPIAQLNIKTAHFKNEQIKFKKTLLSLKFRDPKYLSELNPTDKKKRKFFRDYNIQKPEGKFLRDMHVPFIDPTGPIFKSAIGTVGRKLFLGLHYKYTGKIVPENGIVIFRWDNIETVSKIISQEFISNLDKKPIIKRNNEDLSAEFDFRFGLSEDGSRFLVSFRDVLFLTGCVFNNPSRELISEYKKDGIFYVFPPFRKKDWD